MYINLCYYVCVLTWSLLYFVDVVTTRKLSTSKLTAQLSCSCGEWGDGKKVWYEWAVTRPHTTPIHNPNGRFLLDWIVTLFDDTFIEIHMIIV